MDSISINTLKGYDNSSKMEEVVYNYLRGGRHKSLKLHSSRALLAVVSAILFILVIVILGTLEVGTFIINNNNNKSNGNSTDSVLFEVVCNVTHYPKSCVSSLQQQQQQQQLVTTTDLITAGDILRASISVAQKELSNLSSIISSTISSSLSNRNSKTKRDPVEVALRDCEGMIEEAVDKLDNSIASLDHHEQQKQNIHKVNVGDIRTWVSAALTDLDTCYDSLEDYIVQDDNNDHQSSILPQQLKKSIQDSKEHTSNTLSLISNLHLIPPLLHHHHYRRKLLSTLDQL